MTRITIRFHSPEVNASRDDGLSNSAGTDENGYYHIPILNGTYDVDVFAEGFEGGFASDVIVLNNTVNVDFIISFTVTGIDGFSRGIPEVYALDQNYLIHSIPRQG